MPTNPLARFENFMESLIEGGSLRLMRGQLQPVELAKRLGKAMEMNQRVGVGGVQVPHEYRLCLHPEDYTLFRPYEQELIRELEKYLRELARERGFVSSGMPAVRLEPDAKTRRGEPQAQVVLGGQSPEQDTALMGHTVKLDPVPIIKAARPKASLVGPLGGQAGSLALEKLPFHLGRALDNDLILEDADVSRHHAEIREVHGRLCVVDLGSTNGTLVNGERVEQCVLRDGDVLSFGGLRFSLHLEENGR